MVVSWQSMRLSRFTIPTAIWRRTAVCSRSSCGFKCSANADGMVLLAQSGTNSAVLWSLIRHTYKSTQSSHSVHVTLYTLHYTLHVQIRERQSKEDPGIICIWVCVGAGGNNPKPSSALLNPGTQSRVHKELHWHKSIRKIHSCGFL